MKLQSLLDKDDPKNSSGSMGAMMRKLHWPLKTSGKKAFTYEIEGHKATLSLALDKFNAGALCRTSNRIEELRAQWQGRREQEERLARREENQRILNSWRRLDPESMQTESLRSRYPETGTWFTDGANFEDWFHGRNK